MSTFVDSEIAVELTSNQNTTPNTRMFTALAADNTEEAIKICDERRAERVSIEAAA